MELLSVLLMAFASACASSSTRAPQDSMTPEGGEPSVDARAPQVDARAPTVDARESTPDATFQLHDSSAPNEDADEGAVDAGISTSFPGYTLTWSDEFNDPDGSAVDSTKWVHETGGNNANDELEIYTSSLANSQQSGGNLVITATTDGQGNYYSARINTSGHFSQQYGRFEARAQLPSGQGFWPAFWMLGNNIDSVGWPACGEIDIMETVGTDVGENHGSLHSPNWDPSAVLSPADGGKLSTGFHTYALEWDPDEIRFYLDDALYETQDKSKAPNGSWVFDQPFFIIINLAVGGDWPGSPDSTTVFPSELLVDWVRVYEKNAADN